MEESRLLRIIGWIRVPGERERLLLSDSRVKRVNLFLNFKCHAVVIPIALYLIDEGLAQNIEL